MISRRRLVVAVGAGALAAPFASFAQVQGKVWRVGFLGQRKVADVDADEYYGRFRPAMRELGYVEGKNLVIEWRFGDDTAERLPQLAAELVSLKVDVIVAAGSTGTAAAQKATSTMPIVMVNAGDPVTQGFVKSLAHPGGNISGTSVMSGELGPKHLELLLGMAPKVSRVAVLVQPGNTSHVTILKDIEAAAGKRKLMIVRFQARNIEEIERAFPAMAKDKAQALIIAQDPLFNRKLRRIAGLAAKHRLPAVTAAPEFTAAGGLISYGASVADGFRQAALYVDKIFKGAKPGDIPAEQPTKFELLVNRKAAKALGLAIPQSILVSADKVIE